MLTTEQLNAIKERAEKATAGPWEYIESDSVVITLNDNYHFAMEVAEELGHGFDGLFIAHARLDIPALIAEVERLRNVNRKYYSTLASLEDSLNGSTHYHLIDIIEGWDD